MCNTTTSSSNFKGNADCTSRGINVFVGHCLGYINPDLSKKLGVQSDYEGLVLSRCPYSAGPKSNLTKKVMTNNPNSSLATVVGDFCKSIFRNGSLCGKCIEGYGVSIFSPTYECKNCSKHSSMSLTLFQLFSLTAFPLTVLFVIIVVFHISLTSAPTNAYIFFSHVTTTKLSILIIESTWAQERGLKDNTDILPKVLFFPLYIWNLDFSYYFPKTTVACITHNTRIEHVLFGHYFYALYPMALLLLTLILAYLHGRNCKLVVVLWKPLCYLCVRIRRNWNVRTSLIDAFAACTLLSYSKLIDVSISFTSPNPVYNATGNTIYNTLHYDIDTIFLSSVHLPFFIIGIIMLLTFGLALPLLLILYPFRWFQKLLNALRINRFQSLHIFLDAFQGCYKNGTNGTPERRYFAGLYFIIRIVVLFVAAFGSFTVSQALCALTTVYAIFLCLIAILQPYKKKFYNMLDASILLILTVTSSNTLYMLHYAKVNGKLPHIQWPFTYALLLIPTVYMFFYVLYWILTRFRARCCQQCCRRRGIRYFIERERRQDTITEPTETSSPLHTSLDNVCDSFPYRVTNPHLYDVSPQQGIFRSHSISEQVQGHNNTPLMARYGAITY